jgi:hypothetical protein
VLKERPKTKFDITYQRGLINGEDKVIVELYLNGIILAQGFGDPADIIGHLEATLERIKNPPQA